MTAYPTLSEAEQQELRDAVSQGQGWLGERIVRQDWGPLYKAVANMLAARMDETPTRPQMVRHDRYWPDGSYCPQGRTHVAWTTITTTADSIEGLGTPGTVTPCGCGQKAWVAVADPAEGSTP